MYDCVDLRMSQVAAVPRFTRAHVPRLPFDNADGFTPSQWKRAADGKKRCTQSPVKQVTKEIEAASLKNTAPVVSKLRYLNLGRDDVA